MIHNSLQTPAPSVQHSDLQPFYAFGTQWTTVGACIEHNLVLLRIYQSRSEPSSNHPNVYESFALVDACTNQMIPFVTDRTETHALPRYENDALAVFQTNDAGEVVDLAMEFKLVKL